MDSQHDPVDDGETLPTAPHDTADAVETSPEQADVMSAPGEGGVRRDHSLHAGAPDRLDDDVLAARAGRERTDAGLAANDVPGLDVPPALDRGDER